MTPEARRQIEATIAHLQALLDADCDCPETTTLTVRELWDRYMETLPTAEWVTQLRSTMKLILAKVGHIKAAKLRVSDVEDYRDDPEIRERYESSTRNLQIRRLRTCFAWAVDTERLIVNPLQKFKFEKPPPKRETEISADDEKKLLEWFDDTMTAFFLVAIDSGMRRDEVRLLEWADINWDERKIRIPASRTKTRKERVGRLTTRAAEALKKIQQTPGCPWVFTSPRTKRPYTRRFVWTRWTNAVKASGVKPSGADKSVRLHDSRATTISRMVRLGASIPAIQVIVGHQSLRTTERYIRVQGSDVDAAHALLEAHLLIAAHQRKGPQRAKASGPDLDRRVAAAGAK